MKRSKKSLFNAILVGFLSASMVFTTPMASFAEYFDTGEKVTVDASDIHDNYVNASNDTDVTVNGSLSRNDDGESIFVRDDSSVTVKGNVDGDIINQGGTVSVDGNVTNGNVANKEEGTVNISGDVTVKRDDDYSHAAVSNRDAAHTKIDGNVKLDANSGTGVIISNRTEKISNIDIGGNIDINTSGLVSKIEDEEESEPAYAEGVFINGTNGSETNVNIGGKIDVKGKLDTDGLSILASEDHDKTNQDKVKINVVSGGVTVSGSQALDEGDGLYYPTTGIKIVSTTNSDINVVIKGDVKSNNSGIWILNDDKDSETNTNIFVTGSIEAEDTAIDVDNASNKNKVTITAWKIKSTNEDTINVGKKSDTKENTSVYDEQGTKDLASNINYIIRHDGAIQREGTRKTSVDGQEFETAHEKEKLTIHVKVDGDASKYKVEAGSATATKNADGSWTLIVPKNGGVDIRAVLMAIEENKTQSSSSSSSSSSRSHSSSGNNATTTTTTSDGATVQTTVSNSGTANLTSAVITLGSANAQASTAVNQVSGGTVTFKKASGNLAGASFKGVGQISADGTMLVKEDGTTAKMATGMLLSIQSDDGNSMGCFVDATGNIIATGSYEVYYMLGTDGKLHAHFVNPNGYFLKGVQTINGQIVTFNAEGEMVGVQ